MTNQEILEKLREAERLVIRALRIMHEVRKASSEKTDNSASHKRRDARECASLITHLFGLVEPHVIEDPDSLDLDVMESDWMPRGILSEFRCRYEVLCGLRKHEGFASWKFPKV